MDEGVANSTLGASELSGYAGADPLTSGYGQSELFVQPSLPNPVVAATDTAPTLKAPPKPTLGARAAIVVGSILRRYPMQVLVGTLFLGVGAAAYYEYRTSRVQALVFSRLAQQATFSIGAGQSTAIRFPAGGPADRRAGYARIPEFTKKLEASNFALNAQARLSPTHLSLIDAGVYPIYQEKIRTGLVIKDRAGEDLYRSLEPFQIYKSFDAIPALAVKTLLFIENRELLDPNTPYRNPAIEWDRFGLASLDIVKSMLWGGGNRTPGGSTLATQMEKFRHSPGGRTGNAHEKLRQLISAALRSYENGPVTTNTRNEIFLNYVNSTPLGGTPSSGEIIGLRDGLRFWYGADAEQTDDLLSRGGLAVGDESDLHARAVAYKRVLSLFLAQRRPARYLGVSATDLNALANRYLMGLCSAGVISPAFRDEALHTPLEFDYSRRNQTIATATGKHSYLDLKAANVIRTDLLRMLDLKKLYVVDRLDLNVKTTFDQTAQTAITNYFKEIEDPNVAAKEGLVGHQLLSPDSTNKIIYSFTLLERVGGRNVLRVQTDNLNGPFNVNEGGKVELGSTAKLRTLVTYLEIINELHDRYADLPKGDLDGIKTASLDPLSRWSVEYLRTATDKSLQPMLEAAMQRQYSGNPGERFFTGGGVHTFVNFTHDEDYRVFNVYEGLQHSVNLVFIRLMRDVVNYYIGQIPYSAEILADPAQSERSVYLSKFADGEGKAFLAKFYRKHKDLSETQSEDLLAESARARPRRLAAIFRALHPSASYVEFKGFMTAKMAPLEASERELTHLFETIAPDKLTMSDLGYVAGVHGLELWTVKYLGEHPKATFRDVVAASAQARQESYHWLFKTSSKMKQDKRIKIELEQEAFAEIHKRWKRVGFPFESLVPSYATALGSSGDKPAALAELMGIIVNNGVRLPTERIDSLHFAEATPYDTLFARPRAEGAETLLKPEITQIVRKALAGVVDGGTAVRVRNAFVMHDGTVLPVGGKTGTGDNRREVVAEGGRVIASKAVSRTGTFVFYIGDRFFGTITAYVPETGDSAFHFTSALPVQILKVLEPKIMPLIEHSTATL